MSHNVAIHVQNLSKCYHIYDRPHDRLKQSIFPRLQRLMGYPARKYHREFWALKDVCFDIKKGETVGIIGRNGCGKSTLLQLICGTLFPTEGTVETYGRVAALLELGSGFNPEFTGTENIYLNGAILGLSPQEVEEKYEDIVTFADLGEFIGQPVKTYSSGMFVRLAFAIQANVEPEILVVDEALAVGDAYFVHRCMLRFRDLQDSGTTILFVSHDANSVRNLCSRTIWLVDGVVRKEGNSSEVVDAYLAHLFRHPVVTTNTPPVKPAREMDREAPGRSMETSIPNIDRRLGDQKCQIVGVGLYDESLNKISSSFNEKMLILRLTIKNQSLDSSAELVAGYIFRNTKGQEIASTNSQVEGYPIPRVEKGDYITIQMKVTLPCLYPGSYAFSVTTGYMVHNGDITLSDRIENAVILDVLSAKRVHVLMAFPTTIVVEN